MKNSNRKMAAKMVIPVCKIHFCCPMAKWLVTDQTYPATQWIIVVFFGRWMEHVYLQLACFTSIWLVLVLYSGWLSCTDWCYMLLLLWWKKMLMLNASSNFCHSFHLDCTRDRCGTQTGWVGWIKIASLPQTETTHEHSIRLNEWSEIKCIQCDSQAKAAYVKINM